MNMATAMSDLAIFKAAIYDSYCREVVENYTVNHDGICSIYGAKFNFSFKTKTKLSVEQLDYIGSALCSHFSDFVTPEIMECEDKSKSFYIYSQTNFERQTIQIHFGQNTIFTSITDVPLIEF